MGRFDGQIEWLRRQMSRASEAIEDITNGQKIEINDQDITVEWMFTYGRIVSQCEQLIAAYEKRND